MKKTIASIGVALMAITAVSAASAATTKHQRMNHETYSNVVTEGNQVLGADPDVSIRSSLIREGDAGAGTN